MLHLKFANNIKKKYQERLINREQQWPHYHGEKFISLSLVEGERDQKAGSIRQPKGSAFSKGLRKDDYTQHKCTPIAYVDLFKVEGKKKPVRKVLVEGDAGIGKTTLCTMISEDWANDKLFQQFELLLLLPLREREVANTSSLIELLKLFHPSESLCSSVARFVEEEDGEKTLIIADGWDELSVIKRDENSFLYKLFFGKIFSFLSVVVTSRYSASAVLHDLPYIDRFIEVTGFSRENIADFINSEFANDRVLGRNLCKKLESSPLIGSVCSVPLCCVIICHLWRTLEEDLPTTMTDLYTKITLNILIRNVRKSFPQCREDLSFSNFGSLPADLKQSWNHLCEFAFLTIKEDQIVFSRDQLASFWPHGSRIDENVFRFGLLQSAQSIFDVGSGTSFHFLHLTFQEYLAALHLSRQPFETQVEVCNRYTNTNRFDMVIRFLFGITSQTSGSEVAIDKLLTSISHCSTPWTIYHCLFEACHTNLTPVEMIYERLFQLGFQVDHTCTAHDVSAFIHVISHTHKNCSIFFNFAQCGATSKQIAMLGQVLSAKKGMLQVEGLNLSGNQLTDKDTTTLFSDETAVAFKSLTYLAIDCNLLSCKGFDSILTTMVLSQCELKYLNLSYNQIGSSGLQALERALHHGALSTLETISLKGTFTDDADTNAALLISLSDSLSIYCLNLTTLDVSENNLGTPGGRVLSTVLSHLTQHLNESEVIRLQLMINDTNFRFDPLFMFQNNTSFQCNNYYTLSVNLSNNPIGLSGVIAIGHMICENEVYELKLEECQLTCDVPPTTVESQHEKIVGSKSNTFTAKSIGSQLCIIQLSSSLRILILDKNDFSGENIYILAGFMHLCPLLFELSCNDCGINSKDLINLFIQLDEIKSLPQFKLKIWWLSGNVIDDDGVTALIKDLPSFYPNLKGTGIVVDDNLISRPMTQQLSDFPDKDLQAQWQAIVLCLYHLAKEYISNKELLSSIKDEESFNFQPLASQLPLLQQQLSVRTSELPSPRAPSPPSLSSPPSPPAPTSPPSLPSPPSPPALTSPRSPPSLPSPPPTPELISPPSPPSSPSIVPTHEPETTSTSIPIQLHQLDLLEGKNSTVKIINTVASRWDDVALRLHFSAHDISRIERDHKDSVVRACRTMFSEWLEGQGRPPISWNTLIEALKEADYSKLASKLEIILSS